MLVRSVTEFGGQFTESLRIIPSLSSALPTASAGVHRLTFGQFARELAQPALAESGLAPLSGLGQEAVAARVTFGARSQGSIQYFAPVAGLPGFARALARTLRELRLAGTTPEQLQQGAAAGRDLAVLLTAYEAELHERRLVDLAGLLELARDAAERGAHRWAALPVAFLDVRLDSLAHRELFAAVVRGAPAVMVAVRPGESGVEDVLGVAAEAQPEPSGTLAHLRRFLFAQKPDPCVDQDGQFEYFSAPGEGLEAVEIARRILRLASEGLPFDDCAILLRNPERYQPMIEDALRRAGIPAYFTRGAVRPDPAGRAFLALLGCAADNLAASRFAEYMSLGQIPEQPQTAEWTGPEDELLSDTEPKPDTVAPETSRPAPRRWEQYLVDAAVIGGRDRWERRLLGLEAEWALDPEENAERLGQLRNLREFALPLIGQLAELPATASWQEWLPALRAIATRALRAPDGVLAMLAELEPMAEVGPVHVEEVMEVLSDRLRFLRREPPQRRWGRVFVGSVDDARGREFGVVFLPGLAEGLFPQRLNEDPLLLDELRRAVDAHLPLRRDHVEQERQRLHLAVAAARDRLIVSYPRMDVAETRPRVPSFYALELPRALHGALPELRAFERAAREAAPARLNWPAPESPAEAIDDGEYDLASIQTKHGANRGRHIVEANEHAARSLRARWLRWDRNTWKPSDGLIASRPETFEALAAERLTARAWSPSTLESLAVCPYKFALRGVFRLRPREEAVSLDQMDPRTRGSLYHEVQRRLHTELAQRQMLPVSPERLAAALAQLETILAEVAAEFRDKLAPAIPRVWEAEIDGLRTDLRGWLHFVASNESDWEPVYFEREFDVVLPEAHLHGRVDVLERSGEAWRVVDYKTGKPPEKPPLTVGGGKILQPLLYALAAQHDLGVPVAAGRLMYATQRGGYKPLEIRVDARARMVAAHLLAGMDSMIAGGFLPPKPEQDACKFCDYRVVCGPYEPRRIAKKDQRDERLETLTEIRGMA